MATMSTLYIISAKTNGGYEEFKDEFTNHKRKANYLVSANHARITGLLNQIKKKLSVNLKLNIQIDGITYEELIKNAREVLISKPDECSVIIEKLYVELKSLLDIDNPYYDYSDYDKNLFLIIQKCFDHAEVNIDDSRKYYNKLISKYYTECLEGKGVEISKVRILAHKDDFGFSREQNRTYSMKELVDNEFLLAVCNTPISDITIHTFSHDENDSPRSFPLIKKIIFNGEINEGFKAELGMVFNPLIEEYYDLFNESKN